MKRPLTHQTGRFWMTAIGAVLLGWTSAQIHAFSLLGPYAQWMTESRGYRQEFEIGGPMRAGEEYRWNIPKISYGFDRSFIDYFGSNGVAEVEAAVQLLNSLPAFSEAQEPTPLSSKRTQFSARDLGLIDLKTAAMGALLEQLGLADPGRFAWSLDQNYDTNVAPTTNHVVNLNYSRIDQLPSPLVNAVELGFEVQEIRPGVFDAVETAPTDPSFDSLPWASRRFAAGEFYVGLTTDDLAGLTYLYSQTNVNIETLPSDARAIDGSTNFVNLAARPGIDKLTFVRHPVHPITAQFAPLVVFFNDRHFVNGTLAEQTISRRIMKPDILFSAADLSHEDVGVQVRIDRSGTDDWINLADENGSSGGEGPGTIPPGRHIIFNRALSALINSAPFNVDESTASRTVDWASFDGRLEIDRYPSSPAVAPAPQP